MSCVEHAVPRARQQLRNATVTSVQSNLSLPTPSPPPLSAPSSLPPPWPVLATSSIFATDASRSYRPWAGFLQPSPPTPTLPPPGRRRPHVFRAAVSLVLPRAVELERVQAAVCRVGIGMSRPVCPDWVLVCDQCVTRARSSARRSRSSRGASTRLVLVMECARTRLVLRPPALATVRYSRLLMVFHGSGSCEGAQFTPP